MLLQPIAESVYFKRPLRARALFPTHEFVYLNRNIHLWIDLNQITNLFVSHGLCRQVHSLLWMFSVTYVCPRTEEIRLTTIATAKISNKFSRESPYISNTFSGEFPKLQARFHMGKRSRRHSKDLSGKIIDLGIQIFQVWSLPWADPVVYYEYFLLHMYAHGLSVPPLPPPPKSDICM